MKRNFSGYRPEYMERRRTISTHTVDTNEVELLDVMSKDMGLSRAQLVRAIVRFGLEHHEEVRLYIKETDGKAAEL